MGEEDWKDKLSRWIARKLPRRVVYFATLRLIAYATTGKYAQMGISGLYAIVAVDRWNK